MVSTGIPGIVFGFLHLFYCILCGLQGVPVASNYPVWSDVMIISWYYHKWLVHITFSAYQVDFSIFSHFGNFWYQPCVKWTWNWFTVSFMNSTVHVYAYFYIFLLLLWHVTSISEMVLFGSVNLGHGTDACLHYTLNDFMLQMTQVFIFTFVVQWRLVLLWKSWAFCKLYWVSVIFIELYETFWCMWVYLKWQLNCNEELYI